MAGFTDDQSIVAVLCTVLLVQLEINGGFVNPIDATGAFPRTWCNLVQFKYYLKTGMATRVHGTDDSLG